MAKKKGAARGKGRTEEHEIESGEVKRRTLLALIWREKSPGSEYKKQGGWTELAPTEEGNIGVALRSGNGEHPRGFGTD